MCRDQAGIGGGSTLEFSDVEVFQRIMDVNYMGSVRVAKAFLAMSTVTANSQREIRYLCTLILPKSSWI